MREYNMKLLTKELVNDVSFASGISPSYIEKDWYLVQILQSVTKLNTSDVKIIFAGGTCLSKAYSLTKRFSEDVDFDVIGLSAASRKSRANYRDVLISLINDIDGLEVEEDTIKSRDESRFCNFYVKYPKIYELESSLRNNLKIEISFKDIHLPTEQKIIKSFVGNYVEESPSANIDCISCIETAANKFNALLWRIDIKDRTQPFNHMTNDPALMRHLYDLNILYPILEKSEDFIQLTKDIYKTDCTRGNKERHLSLEEFCNKTVATLKNDPLYRKEYQDFVSKMVYLQQDNIDFDEALHSFEKLTKIVCNNA